jgi:16S rRNA processing protein RimM
VGRVIRPHGLHGDVVVDLLSNRAERARPGARFVTAAGELVVTAARPFQHRWLMHFEGVADRAGADALRDRVLRAAPLEDDAALWVHELVGADVVRSDTGEQVGQVVAVVANPASDLLELADGRLVPVRFISERRPGVVVVDVPAGLLD